MSGQIGRIGIRLLAGLLGLLLLTACSEEMDTPSEAAKQNQAIAQGPSQNGTAILPAVDGKAEPGLAQEVEEAIASLEHDLQGRAEYPVSVQPELSAQGVNCPLAVKDAEQPHAISAYVTFERDLEALLQLRAYNARGQEIGRSKRLFVRAYAADGIYLNFIFDAQMPLSEVQNLLLLELRDSGPDAGTSPYSGEPSAF